MMKNNFLKHIVDFVNGDFSIDSKPKTVAPRRESTHKETTIEERFGKWHDTQASSIFKVFYNVASVLICTLIILVLIITVSFLPEFGNADNPVNNEVSQRYIENGLEETGAVNMVSGMILDYRAFDTLGESAVLFIASMSVFMFMKNTSDTETNKIYYSSTDRDPIVKNVAKYTIPFLLMFGIYVVLNGHISPGGGFAGGSIMGTSLILFASAYGHTAAQKVITHKLIKRITFFALLFYIIVKSYSFYTGAHHLETGIPLGTPGAILSSGLILPLNICVGLVVMCTMYSFYSLFKKGDI